jgi:plastocyanin
LLPSNALLVPAQVIVGAVAFAAAHSSLAGSLTVQVLDERGSPVPRVAVYATPQQPAETADATASPVHSAVMDQTNNAFVPHVLIVQRGTSVLFPNNDAVSHHVYSFSEAKTFELGLYKGDVYPPVQFDKAGVVVLGCNIHDGMLGYIVVVDTPHFALTDDQGNVELDGLADGNYTIDLWTPRARPSSLPAAAEVAMQFASASSVVFHIDGKLAPDHDHHAASLSWERY